MELPELANAEKVETETLLGADRKLEPEPDAILLDPSFVLAEIFEDGPRALNPTLLDKKL